MLCDPVLLRIFRARYQDIVGPILVGCQRKIQQQSSASVVRRASDLVAYTVVFPLCWQPEEGGFDTSAFFEDTVTVLEAVNARIPLDSPHIENRMVRSASVPPIFANRGSGLEAAIEANEAAEAKQEEQQTFRQRGALRRASVPG